MIEDVAAIGSVPLTPYGTPSTAEVPDAIEPYLDEHDVLLLENHGALTMGADIITAYYRMESLELWAKITVNAIILGGSYDISRKNIDKLVGLRKFYRISGRHPGYKKYPHTGRGEPTDR
jgi:L-fuculose-phosphate aldolase